ncbi:MAG: tetratricopeptide repeat protein [Deltaproteobacteria bacterium]|nr:tetratricopeptide repeat protein [Deltaproteobacteria bacterium]
MKARNTSLKHYMIPGLVLAILLCLPQSTLAYDFHAWSHGASGYDDTIGQATIEEMPLILYFHTDGCSWSKKMNDRYLASNDVVSFLSSIPKVEINPDRGADEKALAMKYNVKEYPSFLVFVPTVKVKPQRVYPFRQGGDWTTGEFIHAITSRLAGQYDHGGYAWYKGSQYDKAIRCFDRSIGLDPEDAYAYYMRGIIYHTVACQDRNTDLLKKAEINYMKSLTIDLDQPECMAELEKLQKAMEQMGLR